MYRSKTAGAAAVFVLSCALITASPALAGSAMTAASSTPVSADATQGETTSYAVSLPASLRLVDAVTQTTVLDIRCRRTVLRIPK